MTCKVDVWNLYTRLVNKKITWTINISGFPLLSFIIKRFLFVCFNVSDLWRPLIERFLSYFYLYSCEPTIPKQLLVLLSLKEFLWLLIPRPPLENQWRSSYSLHPLQAVLVLLWSCSPFVAPVTSNKVTEFHRRVSHFDLLSGFLILS